MHFLLDTNVLAEVRRPAPDRRILSKLAVHAGRVATASICIHELVYGAERLPISARRREYEAFVRELEESINVLPYDSEAARWHAVERARLELSGKTTPFVDGQIAAIAATHDLTLATKNARDFRAFRGLRVDSWGRP
jgi:tRNA(fMet)-specific endonuclease VapC